MKRLIIITQLLLLVTYVQSQTIGRDRAAEVGRLFLSQTDASLVIGREQPAPIEAFLVDSITRNGQAYLYIVNHPEGGWVMVSNEQRFWPVVACSDVGFYDGNLSNMIPPERMLFEDYLDVIDSIRFHNDTILDEVSQEWAGIAERTAVSEVAVYPLLGSNYWKQYSNNEFTGDQTKSYNKFIPDFTQTECNEDSGRYVGCTAVAVAQIMWYWRWPDHALIAESINAAGVPSATRTIHYYDWDSMPPAIYNNTPTYQLDAVAGLLRDVGYMEHMIYTCYTASAADLTNAETALRDIFKYHVDNRLNDNLANTAHRQQLIDELVHRRPILCQAYNNEGSGHTFVIDGCSIDGLFHINWGAGYQNSYSCYYNLDNFNHYTQLRRYDVGIYPDCSQRGEGESVTNTVVQSGKCHVEYNVDEISFGTNTQFLSGSRLIAESETAIRLTPGFHAHAGSYAHLSIKEMPCHSSAATASSAPMRQSSAIENALVENSSMCCLLIAPTAATDMITISGFAENYCIFNTMGQLMETSSEPQLNVSSWPAGMYIVVSGMQSGKFIKK